MTKRIQCTRANVALRSYVRSAIYMRLSSRKYKEILSGAIITPSLQVYKSRYFVNVLP